MTIAPVAVASPKVPSLVDPYADASPLCQPSDDEGVFEDDEPAFEDEFEAEGELDEELLEVDDAVELDELDEEPVESFEVTTASLDDAEAACAAARAFASSWSLARRSDSASASWASLSWACAESTTCWASADLSAAWFSFLICRSFLAPRW